MRNAPAPVAFQVQTLVKGLSHPWSLAWLPSGDMLVTEREGRLRRISRDFQLDPRPIEGLPADIVVDGQGGLFDVGGRHFGGRIVLDRHGHVFLTLGDRGDDARAQKPRDHAGSVIRLHEDGRVPVSNLFVQQPQQMPEVFSRGHRNIQGAAIHPQTGELWTHEHGPQGGDELNIVRSGRDYGWPTITYGVNYVTGTRIGVGTHQAGMAQPVHVWVPSIAPSGMAFYEGNAFPAWRGSLLLGALRGQSLVRLVLEGEKVLAEERLLTQQVGRIRDVRVGPDGLVYLLSDSPDGALWRLKP
jgi:glucose/arabinose dehydrogenase